MSARILDGREVAQELLDELRPEAGLATTRHGRPASLAIVSVGHDPASLVYTRALRSSADEVGVDVCRIALANEIDATGLRAAIRALNTDNAVDGILVQLPLPGHLSQRIVIESVDPTKDVDGISVRSAGNLFLRQPTFVPSTCAAVMEMLARAEVALEGARVVVVGASNVVGKPLAFLLLYQHASVTVCHIYTEDLASWTRQADVLIAAAGRPGLITGAMVKPGACVIDVGITVGDGGHLRGDVDAASVSAVAGALSPVPGGIGPLTNLMLLRQTLQAQSQRLGGATQR